MIKLITAIGPNNLIGLGDKMPWHIPNEFKHFKETTMGHTMFMGGRTFMGLPGKLPGRKFAILDFKEVEGADVMLTSIEEAKEYLETFRNSDETVFIGGGKFIYENFYKMADELIISEVITDVKGDTYLDMDLSGYNKKLIKTDEKFKVFSYTK